MHVPQAGVFGLQVEVVPPAGPDPEPLLARLESIACPEVAGFSVATNPLARARMSALALCARIQQRTGKPATLHCTTRDHNRLSLQALLWGARALGIGTVLVSTGDYVALGERAQTTTVRDINVYELVALAREAGLQVGVVLDPGPHLFDVATPSPGGEAPPSAGPQVHDHLSYQVRRLEKKIKAGAQYVVTQPVYDEASARDIHRSTAHLPIPVVLGILPLRSARHARFLDETVAGINVPAVVQARMAASADPVAEGNTLAAEMVSQARRWFAGALLMPPFSHYELVGRILEEKEP
jgi:methylenetetrahydrofolate reductase (NADPH)